VLLREFVTDSLRHHLIADVAVGAFLSSGIDSSALVALATEAAGQPPRTVTLRFEEFAGAHSDEAPLAERFARQIGSDHVTRLITRDEFLADLPKLFDAMDQPTIDGTNTWFVSKAAAERGLKVAISGLGGDELFGSYPSFRALPRIVALHAQPTPARHRLGQHGPLAGGAYAARRRHATPPDRAAADGREEPLQTALRREPATSASRLAQQTAQDGIHRSARRMDA